MKQQFLIILGDPDELSPYSKDNVVELECSVEPNAAMKEVLEREMAEILRDVIAIETGIEKPKYPIKLQLVEDTAVERLIPRTPEELAELAAER